jgi:HEAT repeat protein
MTPDPVVALAEAVRIGTPEAISEALALAGRSAPAPDSAFRDAAATTLQALADLISAGPDVTHRQARSVALLAASATPSLRSHCAAQLRVIASSVPPELVDELRGEPSPHARIGAQLLADLAAADEVPPAKPQETAPVFEPPMVVSEESASEERAAQEPETEPSAHDAAGLDDPNLAVRLAAIAACAGGPFDDRTARSIAAIAMDDPSSEARVAALSALRGAPAAWRRLAVERALASSDDPVLAAAARLLDAGDDEDAVLAARFLQTGCEAAATHAAAVLAERAPAEAMSVLWSALPGCSAPVRTDIVQRLRAKDEHALRVLMRAGLHAAAPGQRIVALAVLGEFTDEPAGPLLEALADPSHNIRLTALRALARRSSTEVIDAIGGRVLDPHPEVRDAAVSVLRTINDPSALRYLLMAAGDPVDGVREAARSAITGTATPYVVDFVVRALDAPALEATAAEVLVELGDAATPVLLTAIEGADARRRQRIGELLQAIGSARQVRDGLADTDPVIRRRAADAVAAMGGRDATATLLGLLHDPEPAVRSRVVELVAEIDDAGAADELALASLREPHPAVAAAMRGAAARMTGGSGRPSRQEGMHG